jgi:hypothetical protein
MDTTRRHRNSTSRHGQRLPSSATRPAVKGSSAANPRAVQQRANDGANLVLGGALVAIAGLATAVGLALSGGGSDGRDWSLPVKLAPWLVVAAGFALLVYGFIKLKPTVRA